MRINSGSGDIKPQNILLYTFILFIFLLIINNCTFIIPENSGTKESTTQSLINNQRQTDSYPDYINIPVQGDKTIINNKKNNPPVADFHITPDQDIYVGESIYFDAAASLDPDGDFLEYYWNFGDGSPSFGPTHHNPVCHTYLIKGEYLVRLTVFDNNGKFSYKENQINIQGY